jgi:hypothetical protein
MQADLTNIVNFLILFLSLLISHPHVYSLLFSFQKQLCNFHTDKEIRLMEIRQICDTHTPLFSTCNLTVCKLLSLSCAKNFNKNRKIYKKLQVKTIFLLLYKMYINTENYTSLKVVQTNVAIQTCFLNTHTRGI